MGLTVEIKRLNVLLRKQDKARSLIWDRINKVLSQIYCPECHSNSLIIGMGIITTVKNVELICTACKAVWFTSCKTIDKGKKFKKEKVR